MDYRFASLKRDGIAYELLTYDSKVENWRTRGNYLSAQIVEYDCYNDGQVKHSPSRLVYGENIVDCLASLAVFVGANQKDAGIVNLVESIWPHDIYGQKIDFAASVKYNIDKRRFYNLNDLKLGSSEKLQYDKRWEVVPFWADGSLDSVCRLLVPAYMSALDRFYHYHQFRDHLAGYGNIPGCLIDLPGEAYEAPVQNATTALHIIDCLVKAERLRQGAERSLASLEHNMTREVATEQAA